MIAPLFRQLARAVSARGSVCRWRSTSRSTAAAKPASSAIRIGLGRLVVLGLRQQIGGDPGRIVVPVGDDEDFRRPGDHVDPDPAEDPPLGRRDIGVARADDLVDRRDRRGAVGQRRDRLRPADPVDLVDAGQARRRQHQRVEHAVRRRHRHREPLDAGDPGRDRVHQHRGRIRRGAARDIKADRRDRRASAARAARRRRRHNRCRTAIAGDGSLDPLGGDRKRGHGVGRGGVGARRDLVRAETQASGGQRDAGRTGSCIRPAPHRRAPATSSMMRATAASTSPALSRFAASSARNAASKPGSLVSRIITARSLLSGRERAQPDCKLVQQLDHCAFDIFAGRQRFGLRLGPG